MDLTVYNVILGPVMSSKADELNRKHKKLVLRVHPHANKALVKEAFKKLFNLEVERVNIMVREGKNRKVGRRDVQGVLKKIAIVTLPANYSLDLFDQAGMGAIATEQAVDTEK